jgi:hypothetical protein
LVRQRNKQNGPDFPKQQRLNPSSARKKRQERGNALLE